MEILYFFSSSERYRFSTVSWCLCGKGGGSNLHQDWPAGCDVPKPPQCHHPPGPPQWHGDAVVTQSERSPCEDALSSGTCALYGCRQGGHVSHPQYSHSPKGQWTRAVFPALTLFWSIILAGRYKSNLQQHKTTISAVYLLWAVIRTSSPVCHSATCCPVLLFLQLHGDIRLG